MVCVYMLRECVDQRDNLDGHMVDLGRITAWLGSQYVFTVLRTDSTSHQGQAGNTMSYSEQIRGQLGSKASDMDSSIHLWTTWDISGNVMSDFQIA